MIIRRNFNIYPAIYETTIKHIPGVNEAVLAGMWNQNKEDEDVYLIVEGNGIDEAQLRKQLEYGENSIDKEAQPDKIIFMKIPRKGRQNKVDKNKIREIIAGRCL